MKKLLFVTCALLFVTFLPTTIRRLADQLPTTYALSSACPTQAVSPRAEGLISTPTISSNFSNSTGTCVVDPARAPLAPFKIPTYEDLKSIYYTQSKAPKTTNAGTSLAPVSDGTVYDYTNLSTDITTSSYSYPGTAIVFIDGSIYINGNITATDPTKGLVLVVKNNINIDSSVTRVDAVLISQGTIYTAGAGCPANSVPSSALTIYGSLISLNQGSTPNIKFCRTLSDNSQPAEKIILQPKYLVILRNIYSETYQKWSEIQ